MYSHIVLYMCIRSLSSTQLFLLRDTIFTHDLFLFEKKNIHIIVMHDFFLYHKPQSQQLIILQSSSQFYHARFLPLSLEIITVNHYFVIYEIVYSRIINYSFTTDNLSKLSLYNVQVFLRIHNQHYQFVCKLSWTSIPSIII